MKPSPRQHPESDPIAAAAAEWLLRLDRGLTAAEQDEYSQWLAADSRHGEAIALHRWGWEELDRLAGLQESVQARPDPDLLAPGHSAWARPVRSRVLRFLPLALGAAAAIGFGVWASWPRAHEPEPAPSYALAAPIERRVLEDGSTVALNRGASLTVQFAAGERRVLLTRGEASFTVAKNPARPFIVSASGVEVRAVGTVFNVRLNDQAVEVLVTEGKVRVVPPSTLASTVSAATNFPAAARPADSTYLQAGQHTVVSLVPTAPPPKVASLDNEEIQQRLAWQPQLLDFTNVPLSDIVKDFNRHNSVRLVIADSELGKLRLSASFRSDNVEGFVRLMESDFGVRA